MVSPRYAWAPPASRSLGSECVAFWCDAGGRLFDWQVFAIEQMLGLDEHDRWASSTDGLDVARQNGKGVILQAIEAFFAFELDYSVVMHTAHEFATSQEHQLRLEGMIQNAPHLHGRVKERGGYMHANGRESINLKSGCRIIFKARTKGGGRGWSGDLLVWDEAMVIPNAVVGAQLPTTRASKSLHGRKTIYAGSAVDQFVHEHGVNFARLRERGIAKADKVAWLEWSAPLDDPEKLTEDLLHDRSLWRLANPSMEAGLVAEDTMADEIASMPTRTAAVELLGVGDWPATGASGEAVIAIEKWQPLIQESSKLLDPVSFAFDVTPDRTAAAIAAAGRRLDGLMHVEIIEHRRGTGWVVERLTELCEKWDAVALVCDASGPAGSLLHELDGLSVETQAVNAKEHANACGTFFDLVEQQRLRHLGSAELTSAIKGASKRPLGDAWAWSRKSSGVDISPLVAATLAVWGAETARPESNPYEARELLAV